MTGGERKFPDSLWASKHRIYSSAQETFSHIGRWYDPAPKVNPHTCRSPHIVIACIILKSDSVCGSLHEIDSRRFLCFDVCTPVGVCKSVTLLEVVCFLGIEFEVSKAHIFPISSLCLTLVDKV